MRGLDALVQLSVLDRNLTTPPATPADGDRYIVAATATGAWVGRENQIAAWQDGAWAFFEAREGWLCWVADEDALIVWDGDSWEGVSSGGGSMTELQNLTRLGFGMTADATNPFAAKLNKVLWTAKIVADGGDGDLRYTLNKETAADVLSLLFQSGFSARAEAGLIGDDDFIVKVSPDGSTFHEAIRIDKDSGAVAFPNTSLGGGGATIVAPQGRLTLVSGQPVAVADQIAKTTIYWTPEGGRSFPRWNGSAFAMTDAAGELSCALSGNSGHAGYQQADRNFDVFASVNGSTPFIGTGPSWHAGAVAGSDTARGAGAGSTELERHHGFLVNKNQIVLRIGSASGDTITVPARQAAYLGTMRASANGQIEDSKKRRFLWSAHNRRQRPIGARDTANSWPYNIAAWRSANNSTLARIEFVRGLNEDAVQSLYQISMSGGASGDALIGIGLDSTSAPASDTVTPYFSLGTSTGAAPAVYEGLPGEGYHYLQPLEKQVTTASGASFFNAVSGNALGNHIGVLVA